MCILLLCTSHPKYPLILLSNRDEFLNRSTATADFWPSPDDDILGPLDLAREEHGSWIGISRSGRLAVLVNFRDPDAENQISSISRGVLVKSFLTARDIPTSKWIKQTIANSGPAGLVSVGGFSMVCGVLRRRKEVGDNSAQVDEERLEPFGIFTNRSQSVDNTWWIFNSDQDASLPPIETQKDKIERHTYGLSNSLYQEPWPKVFQGRKLLASAVADDLGTQQSSDDHAAFLESLFSVLSLDEMPKDGFRLNEPELIFDSLRQSIFIPVFQAAKELFGDRSNDGTQNHGLVNPVDADNEKTARKPEGYKFVKGNFYGTRTQTIILVSNDGHVEYVERTLHEVDSPEHTKEVSSTKSFEFDIEGWND